MTSKEQIEEQEGEDTEDVLDVDMEKALSSGWMTEENWVEAGKDPKDWIPHTQFNRNGEYISKISSLKKQNQKLSKQLESLREGVTKISKTFIGTMSKAAETRKAQLEAAMDSALEDSDTKSYVAYSKQLKDLEKQEATEKAQLEEDFGLNTEDDAPTREDEIREYFQEVWLPNNKWYETNPTLQKIANEAMIEFGKKYPESAVEDIFEHALDVVKTTAKKTTARKVPDTEPKKQSKNSFKPKQKIPHELRVLAQGIMDITGQTEDEFMKSYSKHVDNANKNITPHKTIEL